ncbi:MAG: hypothetical protein IPK13_26565 [Deltaproteobacteria bacterium]|nr:hypothetical protein [Deltaproteobacteria bacterium]
MKPSTLVVKKTSATRPEADADIAGADADIAGADVVPSSPVCATPRTSGAPPPRIDAASTLGSSDLGGPLSCWRQDTADALSQTVMGRIHGKRNKEDD